MRGAFSAPSSLWALGLGTCALALAGVLAGAESSCFASVAGVDYDLSPLQRAVDSPYTVRDSLDRQTNFTFNICDDVDASVLPAHASYHPSRANVPAYQYQTSFDTIYLLSGPSDHGWNFSLVDSEFKARGVILQYSGGAADFCSNGQGDAVQRSLSLAVECDPKQTLDIFENVVVVERDNCQYEARLQSVHGCPVVCKSGSGASTSVCNGHGVCGYNEAASRAQCYCSEGFKGSTCQDRVHSTSPGLSVEGVFLIIACIGLVCVLGGIVFMISRLRKLRVDPSAYQGLATRFNELGQLSA